ncbi:MAG: heat-inducible transcription repressor HrcA [Gaiellales bacterium]|nr:heat-inducible transcription repressor HrcA [Gaiellales bacterium]
MMTLTERQRSILELVTERYIRTGVPVSSKSIASLADFKVSSSTVRNEFAVLEELGFLCHPHTSAGRMPTNLGYRELVDSVVSRLSPRDSASCPVNLEDLAMEVDTAMQQTSEAMAKSTNLLALVMAPQVMGARLRHVELLMLQPRTIMVVFIVSTGEVTKELLEYKTVLDAGMVDWARAYLNETLGNVPLSERVVRRALANPELSAKEAAFLHSLGSAFNRLLDEELSTELYVGGASRLADGTSVRDIEDLQQLMELLEERLLLLRVLRSTLSAGKVVVSIGEENEAKPLHNFSLVAAGYGLPQRNLGTVSLIGPTRMDYQSAINTVKDTAHLLSQFLEDRYE